MNKARGCDQQITFVFDGDDTLWMNEWQYSEAIADYFSYLYKALGDRTPNLRYIRERYFQIDGELFRMWGVKRGRVAEAMTRLYKEICSWIEWRWNENLYKEPHEQVIRAIGDKPFDYIKLRWVPGAEATLAALKNAGHKICFLSCYDQKLFPERAEFLELSRFFDPRNIHITEHRKTKEDFIMASGWTPESFRAYAIGNGESDILPALEISEAWRGIYIPHGSTSKFFTEGRQMNFSLPPLDNPRVITIKSMEELLPTLNLIPPP